MTDLGWLEANAVDELAGALRSLAALCEHRPERAEAIHNALVDRLDVEGKWFLERLAARSLYVRREAARQAAAGL